MFAIIRPQPPKNGTPIGTPDRHGAYRHPAPQPQAYGSPIRIARPRWLALRVSQRGLMTWTLVYRVQGKGEGVGVRLDRLSGPKKRSTLGQYPTVSLSEAREKALAIKRLARAGTELMSSLNPKPSAAVKVDDLIRRYSAEHLRRNMKSGEYVEKLLHRHVSPRWGGLELSAIGRSDFVSLLEQTRRPRVVKVDGRAGTYDAMRGGPGSASEVRKWTRAMFQFAVEVQLLPENLIANVRNRDRQKARTRVLTMDELRHVWQASNRMDYPWGPYFRLIMLTGDRRGEWANAQTGWLTPDRTRLEIPAAHYKTGKPQVVPLCRQARNIVESLPDPALGPYIFSSLGGARPISGFSKAKARLDVQVASEPGAPVGAWVVHDLRRSMATHMERLGIEPHVIEVCLGHALKGIGATYRHYSYLPEKAAALQLWANELVPEHEMPCAVQGLSSCEPAADAGRGHPSP